MIISNLMTMGRLFPVLSNGIGTAESKADNTINPDPSKLIPKERVLVVRYRSNYYNGVVISGRNMQVI